MKLKTLRQLLLPFTLLSLAVVISASDAADANVRAVAVPNGGQPMAAKTDSKGGIHLVFQSSDGPQYVSSTDEGKSFSKPVSLVDSASQKPGLEFDLWDLAVSDDGAVHVALGTNAWKLKLPQNEWGYFYTRHLPGEKGFAPVRNINKKPSEGFSLATGPKGLVTAVWMADKLYANVSRDGGKTFESTIEIDPKLNPCNCCTTSSTYGADGRLAILYREETDNERDMYVALWDQTSNDVTKTRVSKTPWKIDSCPMTYYSITRNGDGYLIAWPTKGKIYYSQLQGLGKPSSLGEIETPGMCGMRTGIVAIPLKDGGAVIAWKKDNQLGWQQYDAKGKAKGLPGSVASKGNGLGGVSTISGDVVLFR